MGQNFDQAKCDNNFWPRPKILCPSVLQMNSAAVSTKIKQNALEALECRYNKVWGSLCQTSNQNNF